MMSDDVQRILKGIQNGTKVTSGCKSILKSISNGYSLVTHITPDEVVPERGVVLRICSSPNGLSVHSYGTKKVNGKTTKASAFEQVVPVQAGLQVLNNVAMQAFNAGIVTANNM